MAGEIGTAYVAVKLDPSGINQGLAQTQSATSKRFGQAGTASGKAFAAGMKVGLVGLGAVAVGITKAIGDASDLNEEINKTSVVFGKSSDSMLKWSDNSATAMGLTQQQALAAAGAYGNMFKTIGLGDSAAAGMSQKMVQLAGDMASFHNQDPTEMLDKLRSGLSGEAEPLRQFGVLISDARVKQEAYRSGIAKAGATLTEQQKVQARYQLIMKDTTKAHGDFARTSDGLANKQRILKAQLGNVSAQLGTALLPAVLDLVGPIADLAGWFTKNQGAAKVLVGVVAGVSAALVVAAGAAKVYGVWIALNTEGTFAYAAAQTAMKVATTVATAAQWLLNAALAANPIGLVIIGLVALTAALIIAYKKSETFRNIVNGAFNAVKAVATSAFNWIKNNWKLLLAILTGPIGLAVFAILKLWPKIKAGAVAAFNGVKDAVTNAMAKIRDTISGFASRALQLGKDIGSAIVRGIIDAFKDIGSKLKSMLPSPGDLVPDLPGPLSVAPAPPGAAGLHAPLAPAGLSGPLEGAGAPATLATGLGASASGASGLAGPVPIGVQARRALRGLEQPAAPAPQLNVRVFIGDTELKGMVRVEVQDANTAIARQLIGAA